jgi:hypothetical protein
MLIAPNHPSKIEPAHIVTQHAFYISPDGNDFAGDGSLANPWNTLQKARDHIRENRLNVNMTGDILVYVRAGKYYVSNTIEFSGVDSGSNGFNVIYKNYDALGTAEFIGGERVSGWSQYSGNIYRASVGKGWAFFTLYENGVRARVTRYPDYAPGSDFANSQAPYLASEGVEGSRTVLQYKPGEFDSIRWNFDNAQVYIWSGGERDWFTDTIPIAGINRANHQIILSQETRYPINFDNKGSRYYIQGVSFWRLPRKPTADAAQLSARPAAETAEADQTPRTLRQTRAFIPLLSAPGEFYLDTQNGDLYYWARGGAIADQIIIAPKVKRILSVIGASENNRAHHIQFEGLTFECTDFTDWYRFGWVRGGDSGEGHRYPEFDRQIELPANRTGMLYLENTDHIVCKYNRLRDSGFSAIYMLFYNQYDTIYGNLFERLGYNAVTLQGRYPGEGDVAKYNVISNNYIHHVGELVGHASGVEITNSGYNEVSYSTIHDSPRYAVQWRVRPNIPKEDVYLHDNSFKYLKIYNCGQDSGDTAPVYGYGISNESPYLTNTVEQVTVDNTHAHPSMKDAAPNGVFMDNCSYGQTFKNVRVTSAQGAIFRNNESGNHNFSNVNWAPGFSESLMEYANIGIKSDFPYPITPTGVIVRNTEDGIGLSWERVNNAVTYNVKRATNINGPYDTLVCSEVVTLGCTDRMADQGMYYYVVAAVLASGLESGDSNAALPFLESAGPHTKAENLGNLFTITKFSLFPEALASGISRLFGGELRR